MTQIKSFTKNIILKIEVKNIVTTAENNAFNLIQQSARVCTQLHHKQ